MPADMIGSRRPDSPSMSDDFEEKDEPSTAPNPVQETDAQVVEREKVPPEPPRPQQKMQPDL